MTGRMEGHTLIELVAAVALAGAVCALGLGMAGTLVAGRDLEAGAAWRAQRTQVVRSVLQRIVHDVRHASAFTARDAHGFSVTWPDGREVTYTLRDNVLMRTECGACPEERLTEGRVSFQFRYEGSRHVQVEAVITERRGMHGDLSRWRTRVTLRSQS